MRAQYWNCTKLADIIRGTEKPSSLSYSGWDEWHDQAKQAHPFRYYLTENLLDNIQDIINYIPDRINDVRYYLNNRYYTKTHSLTSTLKRGQWHEFSDRLLYCMFDEFVNFIEIEKAYNYVAWNPDLKSKYAVPLRQKHWYTRWFYEWRCAEAGLACLDWESTLTNNDYYKPTDPEYDKPSPQALSAIEQKALYDWWKNVRPYRPDPYESTGWIEHCDKYPNMFDNQTAKQRKESSALLKKIHKLEKQYETEDEQMMIRLIKIREGLWT